MKSSRYVAAFVILLVVVGVFISCTAEQKQLIKDKVLSKAPKILMSIAQAFTTIWLARLLY